MANVCRAQRRRAPLTLLGDWPENLHPASASSLPSAEDLDRADVLGRAVAGLPPGQRHAVTLFYYADQPAGQIAGTPGAAKASLHKARRRLREYITAHRPDLIPATSRRTPVTAVRIAHAEPRPGDLGDGRFAVIAGGRPSVTHYDTIEAFRAASLVEIILETGRTHQIRVHMTAIRHPCAGDRLYGADPVLAARLGLTRQWLHAVRLGFAHPADGRRVEFTSEYPPDLEHALDVLRAES